MAVTYCNTITAQAYNELRALTDWFKYSERQMQMAIEGSEYLIAAMDGDKTVGAARLVSDGGCYGIIADVIVNPEYRGEGIGKHMVCSIIEYVKSTLEEGEIYGLNLQAAYGRESFYEQMGFVARPTDGFGSGMHMRVKG